jgi:hypothetical protein
MKVGSPFAVVAQTAFASSLLINPNDDEHGRHTSEEVYITTLITIATVRYNLQSISQHCRTVSTQL